MKDSLLVMGPSRMTFSIVNCRSDTARVAIFGHFEAGMIGVFRRELTSLLRIRPACVEVDMSRLRFIDSSGVELLLAFFKDLSAQGGRLILCGLRGQPLEIFEVLLVEAIVAESDPLN